MASHIDKLKITKINRVELLFFLFCILKDPIESNESGIFLF